MCIYSFYFPQYFNALRQKCPVMIYYTVKIEISRNIFCRNSRGFFTRDNLPVFITYLSFGEKSNKGIYYSLIIGQNHIVFLYKSCKVVDLRDHECYCLILFIVSCRVIHCWWRKIPIVTYKLFMYTDIKWQSERKL